MTVIVRKNQDKEYNYKKITEITGETNKCVNSITF